MTLRTLVVVRKDRLGHAAKWASQVYLGMYWMETTDAGPSPTFNDFSSARNLSIDIPGASTLTVSRRSVSTRFNKGAFIKSICKGFGIGSYKHMRHV